jgi:cytochrome c-type protein NapB
VEDQSFGENTCLQCHANGGYAPQFAAYAPVVPHPELISCRQCHVAVRTTTLFDESAFQGRAAPAIHQAALLGSPPPIPHDLQMRENCLACHAGPAAAEEIRVSHPERVNCRQCHVLIETSEVWTR